MTKIDQKSWIIKNRKKWKSEKVTKSRKVKNRKSSKLKNQNHQKSVKIHQKCRKPVLRPKMQKTGVHAVWQKCPHQMARKTHKVTFTPLSDIPPIFWPFFIFYYFLWFQFYHFCWFCVFHILVFFAFWCFCQFWCF